jgi:lipid A ethanolaminephosphotransferase
MQVRRSIPSEVVVVGLAAFSLAVYNLSFWHQLYVTIAPRNAFEWSFIASIVVVAFCLLILFFGLFSTPRLFKPVVALLLLLASAASYFINEYGVVLDADMVRNIALTNAGEVFDLITGKLFLYVACLGILPVLALWALPISYRPFWQGVWFNIKVVPVLLLLMALLTFPFVGPAMSLFREHRVLLHVFSPLNGVEAAVAYGRSHWRPSSAAARPYGRDAHKAVVWSERKRRTLTVLVIGETARAKNFSLNGYERNTNPLLSKVPSLINYTRTHSCGTATAQSVPCLFSGLGRAGYQPAARHEGLLHILQRAGFSVLWRENQGGCAGVCRDVPTEVLERAGNRTFLELGESRDENLLNGLEEKIDAMQGDAVIVLHMMGSHGPAYYKRYPRAFERFGPVCSESQFSRCQQAEIVNAYDNTIVYTDYVLAKLIELLAARDDRGMPTAMIYVSDHGESLGEGNMYLHGLPYAFAPEEQKHVPMMLWLSTKLQADLGVDTTCLRQHRTDAVSHDNFFHSVLGLLDVKTSTYNPGLDIFARCRRVPID